MNLGALQRAFFAHISRTAEVEGDLEKEVRSFGTLSASARLDLYANMYFIRLVEVLREDFPCTSAWMGERFEPLVADYVRAHPSTNPSLAHLGRDLPGFLEARSEKALSELAALEWARAEILCEADAVPVGPEAMRGEVVERFAEAWLLPIPALRVLSFEHDVVTAWRQLEHHANRRPDAECRGRVGEGSGLEDEAASAEAWKPPELSARSTHAVVWRQGFDVFHAEIAAEEADALRDALKGRTVAALCERFGAAEEPVAAAFAAIGSWLSEGMIRGVALPKAA